jgi:hypothetical protein
MLLNTWAELNSWAEAVLGGQPAVPHSVHGIFCFNQPIGIATDGLFCDTGAAIVPDTTVGGGKGRKRREYIPGVTSNYELAMAEDEEIVAVLEALLASRYKN